METSQAEGSWLQPVYTGKPKKSPKGASIFAQLRDKLPGR